MRPRLINTIVRGTPFEAHGRVFAPEARVTTFARREIAMSADGSRAFGFHARRVQPTALIEQTPDGERRHPIRNAARRRRIGHAIVAAAPPIMYALLNRLVDRKAR